MANKRKPIRAAQREDLSKPSRWRRQHGDVGPAQRDADPETGTPVQHHRTTDTLGMMLENGTITPEMHDGGQIFRRQFRSAALDGMRTSQLIRITRGVSDTLTERQVGARAKVAAALEVVGGVGSPSGSCLWHVVGLEYSVREWAMRHGWNSRPIAPTQGQGILIGALGVLAAHYGLARHGTATAAATVGRTLEPA